MAIVTKREFIPKFIEALRRELEQNLRNEGFLYELQDEAWELIMQKGRHIRGRK